MTTRPHCKLVWSDRQLDTLRDLKGAGAVKMTPRAFLRLTTIRGPDRWIAEMADEIRPLDDYNRWTRERAIQNAPFLKVDEKSQRVIGHEGRHRAAALERAGGQHMLVGIILADDGYTKRRAVEAVPKCFWGQYAKTTLECHEGRFAVADLQRALETKGKE